MASFYRREVIQRALEIIWRKKFLWFLGFFAGLATYGGEINFLISNINSIDVPQRIVGGLRDAAAKGQIDNFFDQLRLVFRLYPGQAFGFVVLLLLIAAAIIFFVIISQAAIMRIVGRTAEKKAGSLFDGLANGASKFWSLFNVNLISRLFVVALAVIFAGIPGIVYYLNGNFGWAVTMSISWFIIFVPVSLVVSLLTQYAIAYISLEDQTAPQAMRNGWKLFRENWLVSLEMAFVIFAFNLLVVVMITALALFAVSPYTLRGFLFLMGVLSLELGFLSAFTYASWTILFQRLQEGRQESKLGAWTSRLVNFAGPKKITG